MKLLVILFLITETICYYHSDVGIPEATRIKSAELINERVTGGELADLGVYPFFAGLVIAVNVNLTSICGASIISNTKLITAAHCWTDGEYQALLVEVVLASNTLFTGGTRVATDDVIAHEDFNPESLQNDIAIITVPRIEFSGNLMAISLPMVDSYVGTQCQVVGFGRTAEEEPLTLTQQLSHAYLTVISNEECGIFYGELITDSLVCTSGLDGRGPCGGDSGGPVFYGDEEFTLIGVVSFGAAYGCEAGFPSSHTRVTAFLPWINERM